MVKKRDYICMVRITLLFYIFVTILVGSSLAKDIDIDKWNTNSGIQQYETVTLSVFARGSDNAVWYRKWNSDTNLWSNWKSLGGNITSDPDITKLYTSSGYTLIVFARRSDNALWYKEWNSNTKLWSNWKSLGGNITSDFTAYRDYIFVRGRDNILRYKKYNGSSWGNWKSLGGYITSKPSIAKPHNDYYVFARRSDNAIMFRKYNGSSWSNWKSLGGYATTSPVVVGNSWRDGSEWMYLFVRGADKTLRKRSWDNRNGWGNWQNLGGYITSDLDVAYSPFGGYDVFVLGQNKDLRYMNFSNNWKGLGGYFTSNPDAVKWSNYLNYYVKPNITVVTRKPDGTIWYRVCYRKLGSSIDTWSSWKSLGGSMRSDPVIVWE